MSDFYYHLRQLVVVALSLIFPPFGAVAQASLVKDIVSGTGSSFFYNSPSPVKFGNKVIFIAGTAGSGAEPWISDGTAAGTKMIKNIAPGSESPAIKKFYATDNYVFFFANNGVNGYELWRTDGTSNGTILVKDLAPGITDGINPYTYEEIGFATDSTFYFLGDEPEKALYKTNGEPDNATLLYSSYTLFEIVGTQNGKVYFTGYTSGGNYTAYIYETDGTPSGTHKIKQTYVSFTGIRNLFVPYQNLMVFPLGTEENGWELWKTDGTEAGTQLIKDIAPETGSSYEVSWSSLTVWNDEVYFISFQDGNKQQLWKTDGTESGTLLVKELPNRYPSLPAGSGNTQLMPFGNILLFTVFDSVSANRILWKTDGTTEGTEMIADEINGTELNPYGFVKMGDKVYFSGQIKNKGFELCETDGTLGGTKLTADIYLGSSSSNPARLTVVDNLLYFSAYNDISGAELFKYTLPVNAVNELPDNRSITMSPNPASEQVVIDLGDAETALTVYNHMGKLMYQNDSARNQVWIAVNQWPQGFYFVSAKSFFSQKLIIQR